MVNTDGISSNVGPLSCGVPQGSNSRSSSVLSLHCYCPLAKYSESMGSRITATQIIRRLIYLLALDMMINSPFLTVLRMLNTGWEIASLNFMKTWQSLLVLVPQLLVLTLAAYTVHLQKACCKEPQITSDLKYDKQIHSVVSASFCQLRIIAKVYYSFISLISLFVYICIMHLPRLESTLVQLLLFSKSSTATWFVFNWCQSDESGSVKCSVSNVTSLYWAHEKYRWWQSFLRCLIKGFFRCLLCICCWCSALHMNAI